MARNRNRGSRKSKENQPWTDEELLGFDGVVKGGKQQFFVCWHCDKQVKLANRCRLPSGEEVCPRCYEDLIQG